MKKKPSGFIAHCQCGEVIGTLDYERSERSDAEKILSKWLSDGCAIYPKFDSNWSIVVSRCRCEAS